MKPSGHAELSGILGTFIIQYHDDTSVIEMCDVPEDLQAVPISLEPVKTNGRNVSI